MTTVFLLLGTNMGNRLQHLQQACSLLSAHTDTIHITAVSSVYETAAWGKLEQDDYLNQAMKIETSLSPEELLAVTSSVEMAMGRIRKKVWEPRIIDIDILFYGDQIIHKHKLIIPHPHLQDRKFVLIPLAEIASGLIHPILKKNIGSLLLSCPDPLWVKKYTPSLIKPVRGTKTL